MMRRSLLLLLVPLLLSGSQPPVGCRVNERTVDWLEARTLPPYTGTDPLTTVKIDLCCAVDALTQYENQSNLSASAYSVSSRTVTIQASFDPSFARRFVVGTAGITVPGILGVVNVSDLVLDYGGTSGVTATFADQALVVTTLGVTDPTFFQEPWTLYLRAVCSQPGSFATGGNGSWNYSTLASAGASVTYNP